MKVIMIWGQRHCDYPGEYAPELLAAADEYTEDDNPAYLAAEEDKAKEMVDSGEMDFIRRIVFSVPREAFDAIFSPYVPIVEGEVLGG